jgi:superfamily I DNA/RNA helicase
MEWTEQQQTAIEAENASFIVSAAAGSGKTAVLTERLVKLLSDEKSEIRADRIVAVTFTNAAASELKKKLDRRFRQLINDCPDNQFLLRQQVLLQNAKISTINSFCFDLLRDNITEQGITSPLRSWKCRSCISAEPSHAARAVAAFRLAELGLAAKALEPAKERSWHSSPFRVMQGS